MTKKHYVQAAGIIRAVLCNCPDTDEAYTDGARDIATEIAVRLADMFAADNGHFDRSRFMDAAIPELAP